MFPKKLKIILVSLRRRYSDDVKNQNRRHMWKSLKVEIDLGDPTPITNQVYFREKRKLTCNQSNLKLSFSNGDATENDRTKVPFWSVKVTAWSFDMPRDAEKCVFRYCELESKIMSSLTQVATPCIDGHQLIPEDSTSKGELSDVCAQLVLKMLVFGAKWTS